MATKTAFTLALWDNAAIYTEVKPGDRVRLHDVKIGRRDDQPNLTARYSDQVVVSTNHLGTIKLSALRHYSTLINYLSNINARTNTNTVDFSKVYSSLSNQINHTYYFAPLCTYLSTRFTRFGLFHLHTATETSQYLPRITHTHNESLCSYSRALTSTFI